jgi:hypothetical protein
MKKVIFFSLLFFSIGCSKDDIPLPIPKTQEILVESKQLQKQTKIFGESVLNQRSGISFFNGYIEPYIQNFENNLNRKGYYGQGHVYYDVNRDGFEDILVSYHNEGNMSDGELMWYINSGDNHNFKISTKKLFNQSTFGYKSHKALKTDVNNDGLADFICLGVDERIQGNYTGNFTVLIQKSDGTFDVNDIPNPKRYWFHNGACGDINGDGNVDVITATFIWYGDGKGNFVKKENFDLGIYTNSPLVYEILDIDKDGWNDLILSGPFESTRIVYNNKGVFDTNNKTQLLPKSKYLAVMDIEFTDLDKDGDIDILSMNQLGGKPEHANDYKTNISQIILYRNNGGVFSLDESEFIESVDGNFKNGQNDMYGWTIFKIDDIDGDGVDDIVSESYQDGTYNGLKLIGGYWKKTTFKFGK